jgi:type IV pilus assembly protein PilV
MVPSTKRSQCPSGRQGGSFLLEGMVAILIFAFGILGLVGILAGSIRASNDARYRTEAINLANAIVGDMWTTQPANLDSQFGSGGAKLTAWQTYAASLLPSATGANVPQIDLTQAGLSAQSRSVVITVFWQLPGDTERHRILLTAQIGKNS